MFEDATGPLLQTSFVRTMQQNSRQPSVAIASNTAPFHCRRHSQNPGVRMPGRCYSDRDPRRGIGKSACAISMGCGAGGVEHEWARVVGFSLGRADWDRGRSQEPRRSSPD